MSTESKRQSKRDTDTDGDDKELDTIDNDELEDCPTGSAVLDIIGDGGKKGGVCISVPALFAFVVVLIPVTFTLYHLVKLGVHSNLEVILLSGPSLIEVYAGVIIKFQVE